MRCRRSSISCAGTSTKAPPPRRKRPVSRPHGPRARRREDGPIPAVVASPGLAIGILHMPASTNGATRQPGDASEERAAFDEAVARAIGRLRLLADESDGLARDVIGFQIGLLEDEEFLGPVWSEIDAGSAADRAWADHLAREIADYESAPTSYLRERAADLRDLRDGVAMAFAHDTHSDTLPDAVCGHHRRADTLTLSRARPEPRRRGGDPFREPCQPRGDARPGAWRPDAGAARVRSGRVVDGNRGDPRRRSGLPGA